MTLQFRRSTFLVIALVSAIAAPTLAVLAISEWRLRRLHDMPLTPLRMSASPDLAEGERMARIVGCWNGCHGERGEGGEERIDGIVRQTAPTLSEVLPLYTDEELARLIRYGIRRDGRSAVGMISYTFWALGDEDMSNIIAHLRSSQKDFPPLPRTLEITWRARVYLLTGTWAVAADRVDRSRPRWGNLPRSTALERGRYIASVTCIECHGLDYDGNELERAPSLTVIAMYSPEQFHTFMRTGKPIDGRDIPSMRWVAETPFSDTEISGMYEFLRAYHRLGKSRPSSVEEARDAPFAGVL
jgi:cytochrome c553